MAPDDLINYFFELRLAFLDFNSGSKDRSKLLQATIFYMSHAILRRHLKIIVGSNYGITGFPSPDTFHITIIQIIFRRKSDVEILLYSFFYSSPTQTASRYRPEELMQFG